MTALDRKIKYEKKYEIVLHTQQVSKARVTHYLNGTYTHLRLSLTLLHMALRFGLDSLRSSSTLALLRVKELIFFRR